MFLLWPFKFALRVISLAFLAAVVYLLVTAAQVMLAAPGTSALPASPPGAAPARAIVVLGAPLPSGTGAPPKPNADFTARLELARSLGFGAKHRVLTVLVPVGQLPAGVRTVDGFLANYGVPGMTGLAALANNSAAQLNAAATQLKASAGTAVPVIVVTDAVDAMWTERAAAADGLAATVVSPAGFSLSTSDLGPLWRETSAVAVGRIVGFDRIAWA